MKNDVNLSVALITLNEERDLPATLNSIRGIADEIVVVDSGSTDRTVEIAESFGAKVYREDWKGFGRQKNSAIDKCTGRWILFIDADEEISERLRNEISRLVKEEPVPSAKVYKLRFVSYCFGRLVRHGGWSGFYRVRLFENGAGRYDDREVHENFITEHKIGTLEGDIIHHTYYDLSDYLDKFNKYTSQSANHYFETGKRRSMLSARMSSCFSFAKSYFFRMGFLDGTEGYMLSKLSAMTILVKYAKLRELYRRDMNEK